MILMSIALESIRIAIGIVFLLSTLGKLKDLRGFLQGVKAYKILPAPLAIGYGLLLVPLEGFAGLSLLSAWLLNLAIPVCLSLLFSFFIAVAINVLRHPELPCYCFGTTSGERISTRSLVRLGLLIAAVFIILLGQQFGIVTTWSGEIIVTSQVLIQGLLKATLAAFVLVIGIWILALPDLVQLRGQSIGQRE